METKLFWRSNTTLEIYLYLHCKCSIIEVICFDVGTHKEISNRLYFDQSALLLTTVDDAMRIIDARREEEEARVTKKTATDWTEESVVNSARAQAVASHIIDRYSMVMGAT